MAWHAIRTSEFYCRRFEREAQTIATLGSPHTIDLFDFGLTETGAFYYVMELLIGRDLETLVRDFGPLPADRVGHLLRQACHSLAEAHVRGLVHRDIKPANVYVCRVGLEYDFVKVLDFGLVKFGSRAGQHATLTSDHVISGTPGYIAPEVILGEDVDARADVYAIGCLAYWMLTGQRVFESDSTTKLLIDHVRTAPVPPSQRTELAIPREFEKSCWPVSKNIPIGVRRALKSFGRCRSTAGAQRRGHATRPATGGKSIFRS